MNRYDDQNIREALASCLSGVEALPSRRADILRAAKGEVKVKRKMNLGLVLALILVLLTTSVAVAEALGLFGQIGQQEDADIRLPGLEAISTPVGQVFTTQDGAAITINQAYYDGARVFLSYTVAGAHENVELGEGQPDIVNYDWAEPGVIYARDYQNSTPAGRQMAAWLDGSAPRWAKKTTTWIADSLDMADGTVLNIIGGGGDNIYQADGSYINWKECEVPADKAADEITVLLEVCTSEQTYYQEAERLCYSYGGIIQRSAFTFTVKKDTHVTRLTGAAKAGEYTAEAAMTASAIDLKGEVVIRCPQAWVDMWTTWNNPEQADYITEWVLYIGGENSLKENLYATVNPNIAGQLTYGFCFQMDDLPEDLTLVPVYRYSGEHPDEAIALTAEGK